MASFVNYRFPVDEARKLASLESIRHDIEATLEYCDRLDAMRGQKLDYVLWEALCAAAVVRYARCFASGARVKLEHELLDRAPTDIREAHLFIIDVRSKHVAHSVNEFEENDVTVSVREEGSSLEVGGIGAHQGRVVGLPFNGPVRLCGLCTWLLAHVQEEIKAEQARLLPLAKSYGAEAIRAFGHPSGGTAATEKAATSRRARP